MALQASFSPSSSRSFSSSSFSYAWKYDVFLSFRGPDTRRGFTGHLYRALYNNGIHTFIDDEELERGEEITPSLIKAIEESRIAIPIFSKSYASSTFCLDELVKIMECVKGNGRLVLPLFYEVEPSEVRHQTGSYRVSLTEHEERLKDDMEKVHKWRRALRQAANLSGEYFKSGNEYEYEFIKKIVKVVVNKIIHLPLYVADYPVGLESLTQDVCSRLDVGVASDDGVHMVGIHGMGGVGKSTLARAIYNSIADGFESLCFLEDVRENSSKHGLEHLQKILLSEIVGEKDIVLGSVNKGIQIIKHRLCQKKVLLILDDVDDREQLRAFAGALDWFGSGSRVIIVTRDKQLLECHGIERKYELNGLDEKDARELFEWYAFKRKAVDPSFRHVIDRAVTYAAHLPLALEVIGSNLCGKEIEDWESALDQYERIPEKKIQEILQISFNALQKFEKRIFLDIACCFKGFKLSEVKDILHAHHDVCPKYAIDVLVDKSLMKTDQDGDKVMLHDLIQDMGREIDKQEEETTGKRRLWFHDDIVQVLEDSKGASKAEMMVLDLRKSKDNVVEWDGEAFKDMTSLKTLIIRNTYFSQGPKFLPNSLRVLEWWGYPSHFLPVDFRPKTLVMFNLPDSYLASFNFLEAPKGLVNMRVLMLDGSKCVTDIPDLSHVPNLEKLSFANCENLIKVDESIGNLGKLKVLDAEGCCKLRSFPPLMLTALEKLNLSWCSNLENFPEISGKMENIKELTLQYTAIKDLPPSIQNLTGLRTLDMLECGMLELPSSITLLPELEHVLCCRSPNQNEGEEKLSSMVSMSSGKKLYVSDYNISDEIFPAVFAWFAINVEELDLLRLNFTVLPACITNCLRLKKLNLDQCHNLREIRRLPPNLETLSATRCVSLKYLDLKVPPAGNKEYHSLRTLILDHCENLQQIRGIPPNMQVFSASNCKYLTYSCRSKLLHQELHEKGGNKWLFMPGKMIPEWFQHCNTGTSISFWFRGMFPAISLCVVIEMLDDHRIEFFFCPKLKINGNTLNKWLLTKNGYWSTPGLNADHIFILDEKELTFEENVNEVLLENDEWNHAEIFIDTYSTWGRMLVDMQIGIHVFKEKSSTKDFRFRNPNESDHNNLEGDSKSMVSARTSRTSNVEVRYVEVDYHLDW